MTRACSLLVAACVLAGAAVAQHPRDERASAFLDHVGYKSVDARLVQEIDRLWPGQALQKLSVADFLAGIRQSGEDGVRIPSNFDRNGAVRTFRLFQNFANGLTPVDLDAFLPLTSTSNRT